MADYNPLPATQKRKFQEEDQLVEKDGSVMAADDPLPPKHDEEEGAAATDDDHGDDDDGYISDEDPRLFTKSYWEAASQEEQSDDLDIENYIFFRKFARKEIDDEDSSTCVDGVGKRRKLITAMVPSLIHCNMYYKNYKEVRDSVDNLAAEAIKKYNLHNDEEYKLKKVLNVNGRRCAGWTYYITFRAENTKASDSPSELFETSAYELVDGRSGVHYCPHQLKNKLLEVLERKYVRTSSKKRLPK